MKNFSLFLFLLVAAITSCARKPDYYVCVFELLLNGAHVGRKLA